MMITELTPIYDSRASFYGKAIVEKDGDKLTLSSYGTKVATIDSAGAVVYDTHSATTLRHIKEFLRQHGYHAGSKSQIVRDYMTV